MIVVAIDIGYVNMGVTRAIIDEEYDVSFTRAFKDDITVMKHNTVKPCNCCIPHTKETVDRVAHFIQEHRPLFDEADAILVERQPLTGLNNVEALIVSSFRNKAVIISPNKMHKHFRISHFDYETRKVKTNEIAFPYVHFLDSYACLERQHDIADAVCMTLFHASCLKDKNKYKRRIERLPFDEYRYVRPANHIRTNTQGNSFS